MNSINQQKHEERLKRVNDAVALKEPDRVPILTPGTNTFAAMDAGFTVAETIYDFEKAKEAVRHYLNEYEPDTGYLMGTAFEGQGAILEKVQPKAALWAGMPDGKLGDNDIHQFLEFETIEDDEVNQLNTDLGALVATKLLPRAYGLAEPMAHLDFNNLLQPTQSAIPMAMLAAMFTNPEMQHMLSELSEVGALFGDFQAKMGAFAFEVEDMGFPLIGGPNVCAFDFYSDFLRGTMLASTDLYDKPDEVEAFVSRFCDIQLERYQAAPPAPGRIMFLPMHKGMDGFMSDEHYARFYWPYLMKLINYWIEVGCTPYIYTEGYYNTRFEFLKQLPKGKTIVHFEYVDIEKAKKELQDIACISGVYPAQLLTTGTKQQVIDEAKRIMDVFAPGGGYAFDFDGGIYDAKRENVEALMDTIRTYGKY